MINPVRNYFLRMFQGPELTMATATNPGSSKPVATAITAPEAPRQQPEVVPPRSLTSLQYFRIEGTVTRPTLNWGTSSEQGLAYFSIERSTDGQNWQSAQLAAATGSPNRLTTYNAVAPITGKAKNYFRLRLTNLDGSFTHSEVVEFEVAAKGSGRVTATPNPTSHRLQVKLSDPQPATLTMRSMQGATVLHALSQGPVTDLDLRELASGVYFLTVLQAGLEETLRVVKE